MGANFNYTISGSASGSANYLVAWEQFYPQRGCASTYAGESVRAYFSATYGLTLLMNRSVSGNYSVLEQFGARTRRQARDVRLSDQLDHRGDLRLGRGLLEQRELAGAPLRLAPRDLSERRQPPAMAPTTKKGSAPLATASGSGSSGELVRQVLLAGEEPDERRGASGSRGRGSCPSSTG